MSVFDLPPQNPVSTFIYGIHPDQCGDVFGSDTPSDAPVVLIIHGGYWRPQYDRVHVRPFAHALGEVGLKVISLEYRRIPGNPDAMVDDIKMALDTLVSKHVIIIGHSAGGHLALWAGLNVAKVKMVIALAPISSMQKSEEENASNGAVGSFLGCSSKQRPDLDPFCFPKITCKVVLVHGNTDLCVPVSMTRDYFLVLKEQKVNVNFLELKDIGHFELINPHHEFFVTLVALVKQMGTLPFQ